MAEMFDLDGFAERVDNYFRHVRKTMLKPESAYPVHACLDHGRV
jgi:hypothetical protein